MVVITIPPCPVAAPARTWTRGARATRSFLLLLERGKRKRKERKDERYPTNHHLPLKCTAAQCRSVVSSAAVHLAAHASWKQMHSFYTSLLLRLEGALKRVGLGGKEKENEEREREKTNNQATAAAPVSALVLGSKAMFTSWSIHGELPRSSLTAPSVSPLAEASAHAVWCHHATPSEVKQIIIQVCIRIDQLKHG